MAEPSSTDPLQSSAPTAGPASPGTAPAGGALPLSTVVPAPGANDNDDDNDLPNPAPAPLEPDEDEGTVRFSFLTLTPSRYQVPRNKDNTL
ncbi:hypothetical protein SGCOL_008734 [Colletotrichum sp. CLE4]